MKDRLEKFIEAAMVDGVLKCRSEYDAEISISTGTCGEIILNVHDDSREGFENQSWLLVKAGEGSLNLSSFAPPSTYTVGEMKEYLSRFNDDAPLLVTSGAVKVGPAIPDEH